MTPQRGWQLTLLSTTQHLRRKPPSNLDPENLSSEASKALESLCTIREALLDETPSAVSFVERHWDQIWPWVLHFSISSLKEGHRRTQTERGMELVDKLISITPMFFTYRMFHPGDRNLGLILDATPEVLAFALQMWVMATAHDHKHTTSQCSSFGLLLECYLAAEDSYKHRAGHYLDIVLNRRKRSVMNGVIQNIIRYATPREIRLECLRNVLVILRELASRFDEGLLVESLARDGVRWMGYTFRKLSSLKKRYEPRTHDDISTCLSLCSQYFDICIKYDVAAAVNVIDENIIPYMFKSWDILVYDKYHRERGPTIDLAEKYRRSLNLLSMTVMHRAVLVRLARSIKKVQRLDLEKVFDQDFPSLLHAWVVLRDEVLRRIRIMEMDDSGWYPGTPLCDGIERGRMLEGGFPGPTLFDHAFVRKQVRDDYKSRADHISTLKQRRKIDHPNEGESQVVVIMDYSTVPFVISLEDREVAVKDILRVGVDSIHEKIVALGVIPKRIRHDSPAIAMLHSTDIA
ncbi:hypothetical protein PQX77_008941 [Marasmius sp. AFHP31]|nr:hypothetical protein PQX77_008941 [Marasmius sp. AFHP31]